MRVLNYLDFERYLGSSGITTAASHQRRALAGRGVEVETSPWDGRNPLTASLSNLGTDSVWTDFDVAHCNLIGPGSIAVARHAKRQDIPLILHSHVTREDFQESFRGSNQISKPLGRYLRWFYSQADLVLCPSEYTRRVLESYPVSAPIRPMTNGVDLDALDGYEKFQASAREKHDLDGVVVFAVGQVFERKGLTTFCRVAQQTPYDFAWFGPYSTSPLASKTVKRWTQNPPENVTFTGWVEDIREAYGAGDIYLFPTKTENQGIAVLEAMAAGKAVVIRDIPVFEEFFTDGEDCLKAETDAEFREAVERLAENPELRERLGENARETAEQHSLDRVGEELVSVYRALLDGDDPIEA
ncbi:sulfoquinovosyltransferase protein [Halorhabdus tiamatea SARL4B]|uniref:Glycosyltransferase n=1 Tax=Halorhabdus tiamatea SARL4B TaxID=1033806 RepID=F7PIH2_9EURY|nr:glycosyltransferase family 4 protein [Halorhabdus tiamatea]ERJ07054.1 sulfoquinovosyltransferase protein [Halorhabdus tiamatea SARL4B]CCQ34820.1 glycosyltransferase [Halorhabdus tiamatea SARL4B]